MMLPILPDEIIFEEIIMNSENLQNFTAICSSNTSFQKLCVDDRFWKRLYDKYYGSTDMISAVKFTSYYDLFKLCYFLNRLLKYPGLDEFSMGDLYLANIVNLMNKNIKEIPPEIGNLVNLFLLNLINNQITY